MSLRFTITFVLSIMCLAVPAWADFVVGLDAYNRGDYATTLRELGPLAEQGDAKAQHSLGVLYDKGQGILQDFVQAHMWYNLAAANGEKREALLRDNLAKQMTSVQIAEAQKLAREWKPVKE